MTEAQRVWEQGFEGSWRIDTAVFNWWGKLRSTSQRDHRVFGKCGNMVESWSVMD